VYNPFSLLNTLVSKDFGQYWFSSGTPTFLIEMLKKGDFNIPGLVTGVSVNLQEITDYRAESGDPIPLLYQSGYLTIKSYDALLDECSLGFPNDEVKYAFLTHLLNAYLPKAPDPQGLAVVNFIKDLRKKDLDGFMRRLAALFSSLPYGTEKPAEHYFHSFAFLVFTLMGQYAQAEVRHLSGRTDAVLFFAGDVYVFEFKAAGADKLDAAVQEALAQTKEKNYDAPYRAASGAVVRIGAAFNNAASGASPQTEILRWKIEN
jgi:hypothetical protein